MADMDHMFNQAEPANADALAARRAAAMDSIRRKELRRSAGGHGLMAAAMSFGESAQNGSLKGIVKAAQIFCIGFAFLVPNLLLIYTVF